MKTLYILLACDCGKSIWQPVINAIPCICWGIIVLLFIYIVLRLVVAPLIANCHERKLKDDNFEQEKFWAESKKESDIEALNRRTREFNDLTIHQKILDKVLGTQTDKEVKTIKQSLESLKARFDAIDGEIGNIIIKKKG